MGEALRQHDEGLESIRSEIAGQEKRIHDRESDLAVLRANWENNQKNEARIAAERQEQENRSGGIHAQIEQLEARVEELDLRRREAGAQ